MKRTINYNLFRMGSVKLDQYITYLDLRITNYACEYKIVQKVLSKYMTYVFEELINGETIIFPFIGVIRIEKKIQQDLNKNKFYLTKVVDGKLIKERYYGNPNRLGYYYKTIIYSDIIVNSYMYARANYMIRKMINYLVHKTDAEFPFYSEEIKYRKDV